MSGMSSARPKNVDTWNQDSLVVRQGRRASGAGWQSNLHHALNTYTNTNFTTHAAIPSHTSSGLPSHPQTVPHHTHLG